MKYQHKLFLTLICLAIIIGCSHPFVLDANTPNTPIPPTQVASLSSPATNELNLEVPSLKARYDEFLQIGRAWKEDAYLAEATIYLGEGGDIRYYLDYQSPSTTDYSRDIYEKTNGELVNEPVYWGDVEVRQEKPIEPNNFIDSPEAVKMFMADEVVSRFLSRTTEHCSFLVLEWKKLPTKEKVLVWRLTLRTCGGPAQHYSILASNGEPFQP